MLYTPADPFDLIQHYFPDWSPSVILDVGANLGQSAKVYARRFPNARVHSFEPSPQSFAELYVNMLPFPNVTAHRIALGRESARLGLTQGKYSSMNRLLPARKPLPEGALMVEVRTGSQAMQQLKIDHIDYLKIDTEGSDLEVLYGFRDRLDRIDFVEVEAGMNPYNRTHVPLAEFSGFLGEAGFHLAYLFEQKLEWKRRGRPVLRRCNPLFISGRLVDLTDIH